MLQVGETKMSEKEPKKGFRIPYNADIDLLDKILGELKNSSGDGMKLETLWVDVGAAKNSNRSYTLSLAKYLGLADSDNIKAWLTELGVSSIRYATGDKRKSILAKSMPEEYLSMFKWIKNAQELRSNEIKPKFIEAWGKPNSLSILDKGITTFLNYCQYLKIIRYIGKGNLARAVITDFGKTVLDVNGEQEIEKEAETLAPITVTSPPPSAHVILPTDATYPIKIITNDRVFDWDIKSETDLSVIDSVMTSIKEGWKKNQPRGEG